MYKETQKQKGWGRRKPPLWVKADTRHRLWNIIPSDLEFGVTPSKGGRLFFYLLNDGGYRSRDSSVTYQITAAPNVAYAWKPGYFQGLAWNGASSNFSALLTPFDRISIVAWIFYPSSDGNTRPCIVDGNNCAFFLGRDGSGTYNQRYVFANLATSGTSGIFGTDVGTILYDQWHQVAVTFQKASPIGNSIPKMYINGQSVNVNVLQTPTAWNGWNWNTSTPSYYVADCVNFSLGGTDQFNGLIDHVFSWAAIITDDDVGALYREPFMFYQTPPRHRALWADLPWTVDITGTSEVTVMWSNNLGACSADGISDVFGVWQSKPLGASAVGGVGVVEFENTGQVQNLGPATVNGVGVVSGRVRDVASAPGAQTAVDFPYDANWT